MFNRNLELIQRFETWIKNLSSSDTVAVLHHTDPDGVCSGVIISKVVERIRDKRVDLRLNQHSNEVFILPSTVEKLRAAGVDLLITTDLAVDENLETIKELETFCKIIVIDHHAIHHDLQSEKCLFLKAQNISDVPPSKYCSGKLCYDLGSLLVDVSDLDWIAAIATICDIGTDQWTEFMKQVYDKYNIEMKKDWFETPLGKIGSMISHAEAFSSDKAEIAYNDLYSAKSYKDLQGSSLAEISSEVEKEINDWLENYKERLKYYPDKELFFGRVDAKFNIKSNISTILSFRNPNTTFILVSKAAQPGKLVISARRQDKKVAMNELLSKVTSELPDANGGGHIPAAGATIRAEDYEKFKEKILSLL